MQADLTSKMKAYVGLYIGAPLFAAACKPGAPFALSGILAGQDAELLERYAEWFEQLEVAQREDWVRISGRRKA